MNLSKLSDEQLDAYIQQLQSAQPEPQEASGGLANAARAVAEGATLGFGSELEAGLKSLFTDTDYAEERDRLEASLKQYYDENPGKAMTLDVLGSLMLPGGGWAAGAGKLGHTAAKLAQAGGKVLPKNIGLRAGTVGAGEGAVISAGQSPGDRLGAHNIGGALLGGGLGAAGAGVASQVVQPQSTLRKTVRAVRQGTKGPSAQEHIAKVLQETGETPQLYETRHLMSSEALPGTLGPDAPLGETTPQLRSMTREAAPMASAGARIKYGENLAARTSHITEDVFDQFDTAIDDVLKRSQPQRPRYKEGDTPPQWKPTGRGTDDVDTTLRSLKTPAPFVWTDPVDEGIVRTVRKMFATTGGRSSLKDTLEHIDSVPFSATKEDIAMLDGYIKSLKQVEELASTTQTGTAQFASELPHFADNLQLSAAAKKRGITPREAEFLRYGLRTGKIKEFHDYLKHLRGTIGDLQLEDQKMGGALRIAYNKGESILQFSVMAQARVESISTLRVLEPQGKGSVLPRLAERLAESADHGR